MMAETGERTEAMREDARQLRESVRKDNLEEKLEDVIQERPGVRPFLEVRPIAIAVGVAALLTIIAALLFSVAFAAVVLVLSFGITWVAVSLRTYDKRRPTEDKGSPGKKPSEVAPFSS
jgi:Flp pilus assembly protein TadB